MKIVYNIAGTYRPGGMERVLANKANFLSNHGHTVHIVTTDQRGQKPFFDLHSSIQCHDLDINYENNNGASFWSKLIHYPLKQYKHRQRLQKLLSELQADIVVSMFCNDVSFITDIKDGSKKVLEIHFSKFKRLQYGRKGVWKIADQWRTHMDERHVRKFDRFVVLTHEDQTYWGAFPNIQVIPNSITSSPTQVSALQDKQVIAIGRYTYQKGFDELISIWAKVCAKISGWRLIIVGDGEQKETLGDMIKELQVEDSVSLIPPTSDIAQLYLSSSILALSSRYEGLPMVLLEAQSYGLPIVAYRCKCGPADVITERQDGFIIPEGDRDLFAERLIQLMQDQDLRMTMGYNAKVASANYSEEKIMRMWMNLFDELHSRM